MPTDRPLVLTLRSVKDSYPQGATPAFSLTIENRGKVAEKVLKLRGDLQDTYYEVVVKRDGKEVELSRAISDPGPVTSDDFITLKQGEKVTHELKKFAAAIDRLPPGEYTAQIRFWQNPFESSKTSYLSPEAKFKIEK